MGCVAVCQRPPGKSHTLGFSPRQCSRRASSRRGLSLTILAALAALNVDDHPLAVDVGNLQPRQLGAPHTGGVEGHEQDALERCASRVDELGDCFWAQDRGQAKRLLGVGRLGHAPRLLEGFDEPEAPSREALGDTTGSQLPLAEPRGLLLAEVLGAQLIRRSVEVAGEIRDRTEIAAGGTLSVIATLEFFEHHLA